MSTCESCGQTLVEGSKFCNLCGAGQPSEQTLAAVSSDSESPESDAESEEGAGGREEATPSWLAPLAHKRVWIPLVLIALLVVVGIAGGAWAVQRNKSQATAQAAAQAAADTAAKEKFLIDQFDELMVIRDSVLQAEAKQAAAVKAANNQVAKYRTAVKKQSSKAKAARAAYRSRLGAYNRRVAYVRYWNSNMSLPGYLTFPSRPSGPASVKGVARPNLDGPLSQIKAASKLLTEANAQLTALDSDGDLKMLASGLRAARDALSDETLHNADAITTGSRGSEVDVGTLRTLRAGGAEALMRTCNDQALAFIQSHQLQVRLYDIRGGRDMDPNDSSMLTASK